LTPEISEMNEDWPKLIREGSPIHIDVGCARGKMMQRLAKSAHRVNWHHIGLEIRPEIIEPEKLLNLDLANLNLIALNFAVSCDDLLDKLPHERIKLISFLFPDPWRSKNHIKRRIVQPSLVLTLARYLSLGACIYVCSDVEEMALSMNSCLGKSPYFSLLQAGDDKTHQLICENALAPGWTFETVESFDKNKSDTDFKKPCVGTIQVCDEGEDEEEGKEGVQEAWLQTNPLGEPSERDLVCEGDWRRVWRCIYVRNGLAVPEDVIAECLRQRAQADEERVRRKNEVIAKRMQKQQRTATCMKDEI